MPTPTQRQLTNAAAIVASAIPFEGRAHTALDAFVLLDELKEAAEATNRQADHARYGALYDSIWREHRGVLAANLAAWKAAGYPEQWTPLWKREAECAARADAALALADRVAA